MELCQGLLKNLCIKQGLHGTWHYTSISVFGSKSHDITWGLIPRSWGPVPLVEILLLYLAVYCSCASPTYGQEAPGKLVKSADSVGLGWGLRFCSYNQLPLMWMLSTHGSLWILADTVVSRWPWSRIELNVKGHSTIHLLWGLGQGKWHLSHSFHYLWDQSKI